MRAYATRVRVLLADPPAFTPFYDHELAESLARAGADVELVMTRFRFGSVPAPAGYTRTELFYPLSSRLFHRSRLRLPVKALEHPVGMARLARRPGDVLHVQWLALPELDRYLFRPRRPAVFTAHDILPRRTAAKRGLWRDLYSRFDGVVVHSERGRSLLESELDVPRERIRVIPMPVFRRDVTPAQNGRTVLFCGVIRPYKGLQDALAAIRRVPGSRLLVVGEPVGVEIPPDEARVEWRLGFADDDEVDRAHGESAVAVFPYLPELDQSAALLRALGSGVPAVVYDVGGLPEPVREFGAGRVVPAGDVDALAAALDELLSDEHALAAARAGAARARDALTWERAAAAHLELYRELA
jgi:glycosyltransferase involved in cell wall biosynthesis